jgi:capsule polysaccharide export protein KpsE/RkpR
MEPRPEDLIGMKAAEAREYIFHYISALKLTEKKYDELSSGYEKWLSRVSLAQSKGMADLAQEAQAKADAIQTERQGIEAEITGLKEQIRRMKDQIPGLAARERSIDPDLLEQELLIALGLTPGEELKPDIERRFETAEAEAALEALKTKMEQDDSETPCSSK